MIELSGLTVRSAENPEGDIAIEIVGLRPGEKLYEELLIGNNPKPTSHPRIQRAEESMIPWNTLEAKLKELQESLKSASPHETTRLIAALVDGYTPSGL
jgi:FlaA1/EpsC-like NDP-sugar epimerase